jgi:cytolethal distending toxin subunit A
MRRYRLLAGGIFISYRRDDSHGTAGRLRDRLVRDPRSSYVFMDVDNIPAGVDFVEYVNDQVAGCDVLLAVIGPNWLDAEDDTGQRRLNNLGDYVRVELAAALARKIRLVPVLVDGARMPRADELPDDLKPLVRRNAFELRNAHFGRDADALAESILEERKTVRAKTGRWVASGAGAAVLMLLLVGWIGLVPWPWPASLSALAAHELMLINALSGKCLTISGGATYDNNVDAAQHDCDRDPLRRWWLEEEATSPGIYKIKNVRTTRCLTIAGGTSPENYVRALQFTCDNDPSRRWRVSHVGNGLYQIRNVHTRKCLTISDRDSPENNVRAGAPIQYDCDNDPAGRWTIRPRA